MEQDERPVGRLYHQVNGIGKTPPRFSNIYLPRPGVNRCDSGAHARTNAQCPEGTMPRAFDVIAIGTGSADAAVASRCREAGWQVAIVDSRPFGGTCALRGCDPKKVLVGAAEAMDWTRR